MPNKHEITPAASLPRPEFTAVGVHAPYADPLGAQAVQLEDMRQYQLLEGGQMLDSARRGEQIAATKRLPGEFNSTVGRAVAGKMGKVMTSAEVQLANDVHSYRELGQRFMVQGENKSGPIDAGLKAVRIHLRELTSEQSDALDRYMKSTATAFFKNNKDADSLIGNDSWANWLGSASDKQLMNFLQWHNYVLGSQRHSPELHEEVERQRAMYKRDIQEGVEQGWLGKDALKAAERTDDIDVLVGDQFDTILQGRTGYHFRGTPRVVVMQGAGRTHKTRIRDARNNINNTLPHELNHAVLATAANRPRSPLAERWIDEALTEHISAVMFHGEPDIVKPAEREDDQFVYDAERQLLDFLLNHGPQKVDAALATRAYSGDAEEQQEFYDALDRAWGTRVLPKVAAAIEKYETLSNAPAGIRGQTAAVLSVLGDLMDAPPLVFGARYEQPKRGELVGASRRQATS